MVLFADGKAEVWRLHDGVCAWVTEKRGLEVKSERTVIAPVTEGVAFLGLRIFRGGVGFEPRETGWKLEQHRVELSFGEPEQQRPVEPEPRHWLPPCEDPAVRTRRVPSADARASHKCGDEQAQPQAAGSLTFAGESNAALGFFLSGTKQE